MAWRRWLGLGGLVLLGAGCGGAAQPGDVGEPGVHATIEGTRPSALEGVTLFPATGGADVQHLVEDARGDVFVAGVFRGDLAQEIAGADGRNHGRCWDGTASDEEPFAARVTAEGLAWGRAFGAVDGCAQTLGIVLDGDEVVLGAEGKVRFGGDTHEGAHTLRLAAQTGADRSHGEWTRAADRWALRPTASEVFLERDTGARVRLSLGALQFDAVGESAGGAAVVAGSGRSATGELNALVVWSVAPDGDVLWQRTFDFIAGAKGAVEGFISAESVLAEPDGGAVLLVRFAGTLQLDAFVHGFSPEAWTESWRFLVIRLEPDGRVRWTREGVRGRFHGARLARAGNGGLVLWGVELWDGGVVPQDRSPPELLTWLEDDYGETLRTKTLGVTVRALVPSLNGGLLVGGSTTTGEGLGVEGEIARQTGVVARLPRVPVVPRQ